MTFFIILILILISFLPIVFWGYIFSYIDETLANRKRFFVWIVAGIVSTLPVLYLWKGENSFFESFNIFKIIASFSFSQVISLVVGFTLLIFFTGVSWFILWIFSKKIYEQFLIILKNIFIFILWSILLGWVVSLVVFFFTLFPKGDFLLEEWVSYWNFVFNSFKLVILYYLVIWFIEETSKHFHFLSWYLPSVKNTKEIVLFSIFIALWFAFTENIIYLWNLYTTYGFSWELLKVYIFRSCFSLMLHVVCSALLSHTFSMIWYQGKLFSIFSLVLFLSGILFSIFLHAVFDISLSIGFSFIPFIYFLWGYLYVSSIFYKDSSPSS